MGLFKSCSNLLDLPGAFFASEVNGGTNCSCTHIPCLAHTSKGDLVIFIRIGKELVMVDLYYKRNFMCILAGVECKAAKSRGNSITAGFYGQFNDVFGIKIILVLVK